MSACSISATAFKAIQHVVWSENCILDNHIFSNKKGERSCQVYFSPQNHVSSVITL